MVLAARLCGFADAYGCRHTINRYRISLAVQERLIRRVEALLPDCRGALMAEGAVWSEDELSTAARSI